MAKTRVLVVEDSATIRQRLIEILESDPEIELVGAAEDGKQAVRRLSSASVIGPMSSPWTWRCRS
jgi:chemotaxis response regulator CheB